jgi:hypothetical protein
VDAPRGGGRQWTRIELVVEQYRTRYWDFTVKHFHEALQAEHGFALGYTWTKTVLQSRGLVAIAPRCSVHRKKRPRRPLPGMMLFQDASPHEWLAGQAPLDLIVTLDDATSAIYSIFLAEEEGTASSFRGLEEVISRHGCSPRSIPTGAVTTSPPRRRAARSTSSNRPRSGGPWPSSALSTSRPTAQKPAAAWSGFSGPCSSAYRPCCGSRV